LTSNPRTLYWSVGLTPIQEWIGEARRSRDLLAGSRILSWLMRGLLCELQQRNGVEIITPAFAKHGKPSTIHQELEESYSLPSHASGTIRVALDTASPPPTAPEPFGRLQGFVDERWRELVREALEGGFQDSSSALKSNIERFLAAAPNPFSVLWVVSDPKGADPGEAPLEWIDRLYQAVKRTRPVQFNDGAPVRKCGQCGRREAIGGTDWQDWLDARKKYDALEEVRLGLRFEVGELLCAVCSVKRLVGYLRRKAFPSTSEIAARPWAARCRTDLAAKWKALMGQAKAVAGFQQDPWPLFFESSARRELKASDDPRRIALASVREARETLRAAARELSEPLPPEPSTYLAVLVIDGDGMGEAIQKAETERLPTSAGASAGSSLSERLGTFAQAVAELAKSPAMHGEPFYLGGDEGLLLAPIASALPLALGIRDAWRSTIEAPSPSPERGAAAPPTLSMGIAIFHREHPLGGALEAARQALARAKSVGAGGERAKRKNALAVTCLTASGNSWTAIERWGEGWSRLQRAVDLTRDGTLSSGWAYDVEQFLRAQPTSRELRAGEANVWRLGSEMRDALRSEVRRITYRRVRKSQGADPAHVWARDLRGEEWWREQPARELEEAIPNQFHLVAFLAREGSEVGG